MEEQKNKKRKNLIIIAVVLLLLAVGTSLAYYFVNLEGTKINEIVLNILNREE